MKRKKLLLTALLLVGAVSSFTAKVDTLLVKSPSTNKDIKVIVVTPGAVLEGRATACPTAYFLYGPSSYTRTWIETKPNLLQIMDKKGIIPAYPDGSTSWYRDSPRDPSFRHETFVSSELVEYIDGYYKAVTDCRGCAVTGLSIGGHGGLRTAIRHKDTFGACGSTSGDVDIRPFPKNWDAARHLEDHRLNEEIWGTYTVTNQIDKIRNGGLVVIFDYDETDLFIQVNKNLYNRLLEKGIDHGSVTRPGGHTGEYWNNTINYQTLSFDKFFRE